MSDMAKAYKNKKRQTTSLHKKRQGLHQRRTHHFMKTYWPYIPMLSVVVIGLAINAFWSNQSKSAVLGAATQISVEQLLQDTNAQRTNNAEQALSSNNQLDAAAQAKANDMVNQNYWAHNNPQGKTPWDFITGAGYQYQAAGENLAYGFSNASNTISAWMNSPGHRANILDTQYQDVGFGFATSQNFQNSGPETVIVAEYADPIIPDTPPAASNNVANSQSSSPNSGSNSTLKVNQPPSAMTISKPSILNDQAYVPEPPSSTVSRIQLFTGSNAPWSLFTIAAFAIIGAVVIVFHHVKRWQKVLAKGEAFVIHHPLLEILLVSLITLSFILTRAVGTIR